MSDRNTSRGAGIGLVIANANVTDKLKPYIMNLTYTDAEEDESDDLQIVLCDTDENWIKSWLGNLIENAARDNLRVSASITGINRWSNSGIDTMINCGDFQLDGVSYSGSEITLKCTALPHQSTIRSATRTKAWESYYLSKIAEEMAASVGMTCQYISAYDPFYQRVEQINTSDIAFLQSLCKNAGISLKCYNNGIILFDVASFSSSLITKTVTRGDGSYEPDPSFETSNADTQYASCRVKYTKPNGQTISAIAYADDYDADADDNQQLEIRNVKVNTETEAWLTARYRLKLANKYAMTASFTFPGNAEICAGGKFILSDFGPWSGTYITSKAVHTVDTSGYTVSVDLRKV